LFEGGWLLFWMVGGGGGGVTTTLGYEGGGSFEQSHYTVLSYNKIQNSGKWLREWISLLIIWKAMPRE